MKIMEHTITTYIGDAPHCKARFFKNEYWFRAGFFCKNQTINQFQDLADEVDNGSRIEAFVIDFAKAFDVVSHILLGWNGY